MSLEIEKVHLLITCILNDSHRYKENFLLPKSILSNRMTSYSISSHNHERTELVRDIHDPFWKDQVKKVFVYDYREEFKTCFVTIAYDLKPSFLDEILSRKSYSIDSRILLRKLVRETFPDFDKIIEASVENELEIKQLIDYPLLEKNFNVGYTHVTEERRFLDTFLLVLPKSTELSGLVNKTETKLEFFQRFEEQYEIRLLQTINLPNLYFDYLFHKICVIETRLYAVHLINDNLIRVFLLGGTIREDEIELHPDPIYHLLNFDRRLHILKGSLNYLSRLYPNAKGIESHINEVLKKDVFSNYLTLLKEQRLEFLEAKFAYERQIEILKQRVSDHPPYSIKNDIALEIGDDSKDSSYFTSSARDKIREFEELTKQVEGMIKELTYKDSYMNEYIRDLISAESIWVNLRLQKLIKYLTWIAIALSTASLLTSLYPESIKNFISSILTRLGV